MDYRIPLIETQYNSMLKCYGKEFTEARFVIWQPLQPVIQPILKYNHQNYVRKKRKNTRD